MKYSYNWTLKDANFTKDKGKVFSCFACGGGSTMGYKLAGFDVIGCNEIDSKVIEVYKRNHKPRIYSNLPIQKFKNTSFIKEMYELDILDGSPPCSTFSMAGDREKNWGKMKKFAEGQQEQILDTLFFDFLDLANELQPKVIVAENVSAMLYGDAMEYVRRINKTFDDVNYVSQNWVLNSKNMGVPQSRERIFFIALRKDLCQPFMYRRDLFSVVPKLNLVFYDKPIRIMDVIDGVVPKTDKQNYKEDRFGDVLLDPNKPAPTYTTGVRYWTDEEHLVNHKTKCFISSFPHDYNFEGVNPDYIMGMSVPPLVVAQIADEIYNQWLKEV